MRWTDTFSGSIPWLLDNPSSAFQQDLPKLADRLTIPSAAETKVLREQGLIVRVPTKADCVALEAVQEIFTELPRLWPILSACIERITPIAQDDDAYDVSHSAPELGGLILVSVPHAGVLCRVRLCEGVLHEAMHVNLTALEEREPLIQVREKIFSPWRDREREAGGVLHAVYVFACVSRFFVSLIEQGCLTEAEGLHAHGRIEDINREMGRVDQDHLLNCLTASGAELMQKILTSLPAA